MAKNSHAHDNFFKQEIESNPDFTLYIFRKVFTPATLRLFNWKTLKSEATAYIDQKSRPKMADFVFSIKPKGSSKTTDIVILLEHKTGQSGDVLQQLLEYQTAIYARRKNPIVPVLVYQGPDKRWRGGLQFQDSLEGMSKSIRNRLGGSILNFTCHFLNMQEITTWSKKDLTINPLLYIMVNVWRLDAKGKVYEEFIEHCKKVKDGETRAILLDKGAAYIHRFDPKKYTPEWVDKIERKNISEGDREMKMRMSEILAEKAAKKAARQAARQAKKEGREEGREEVALQMLAEGMNIATICKCTGLTEEQVKELEPEKVA